MNEDSPDLDTGRLTLEMEEPETALLREAATLSGTSDPRELIRTALAELIERRRFQNWVDGVEAADRAREAAYEDDPSQDVGLA